MKSKKTKLARKRGSSLILVPIKIHPREIKAIKVQARKYADGNFSAWLRHAGLRYRPKRGETVESVTMPRTGKNQKSR